MNFRIYRSNPTIAGCSLGSGTLSIATKRTNPIVANHAISGKFSVKKMKSLKIVKVKEVKKTIPGDKKLLWSPRSSINASSSQLSLRKRGIIPVLNARRGGRFLVPVTG